jgi:hypothetical protein
MRHTCLAVLFSLCFCAAVEGQASPTFRQFSYHAGRRYESKVTTGMLENSPEWAEGQDNPPLPARRAVEVASAQLSKLLPDGAKWGLQRIHLQPIGAKWIYVVEFLEPLPEKPGVDFRRDYFAIVVLMNGEAVEPKARAGGTLNNAAQVQ